MPGTNYVSAINVHICRSVVPSLAGSNVPGRSAAYENQALLCGQNVVCLNHIVETLFASETFVKKGAFRIYENKPRAVSDPPKKKSKKRISSS